MFSRPMPGKTKNKSTAKTKHAAQRKRSNPAKKTNLRKRSRARSSASSAKEKSIAALAVLSPDRLKELHTIMVKCRALAENFQKADSGLARGMGPELAGLEAMLVGAGAHLQAQDCVVLERNRLIAGLVRGVLLNAIFAELREFGSGSSSDGKKKPSRAEGASALKITMDAVLAQAEEMKSQRGITVMFCTEHPVTLAGQHDALAIAAERKLPIVCLLENRAEWEASATQAPDSEKTIANEQTFYPRLAVDGNDLVAIFRVAQEATRRAREGHGPALIDCRFSSAIRVAADPILFMKQYLQRRKLWSDAWARKIAGDFNREMKEARASAHEYTVAARQLDHIYSLDRTRQ